MHDATHVAVNYDGVRAQMVWVGKGTELETASKLGNGSCSFSRRDIQLQTPDKGAGVGIEGSYPTITLPLYMHEP